MIVLRRSDLQEALQKAYLAGKDNLNGENDIEVMNQLLELVESKCVN